MSKLDLAAAVKAQRAPATERPAKVRNATLNPARRGKVGMTQYFSPDVHHMFKEIALEQDKKINELLVEGVNLMLQKYGRKPIA